MAEWASALGERRKMNFEEATVVFVDEDCEVQTTCAKLKRRERALVLRVGYHFRIVTRLLRRCERVRQRPTSSQIDRSGWGSLQAGNTRSQGPAPSSA